MPEQGPPNNSDLVRMTPVGRRKMRGRSIVPSPGRRPLSPSSGLGEGNNQRTRSRSPLLDIDHLGSSEVRVLTCQYVEVLLLAIEEPAHG